MALAADGLALGVRYAGPAGSARGGVMKLKLTFNRAEGDPVDLAATVDATATVGDLAAYLRAADPINRTGLQRSLAEGGSPLTLAVLDGDLRSLDPQLTVLDSGLRSGDTISLTRSGNSYADPRAPDAVLTVLEGPDAGREFPLHAGTNVIGREGGCEVTLTDPLVSRSHARINISDVAEIIDLGSANGVIVAGAAVTRVVLGAGDRIEFGDTAAVLRLTGRNLVQRSSGNAAVSFVRSPYLLPVHQPRTFEAPDTPTRPGLQQIPVIALLAPLLMGGLLYYVTRQATTLLFVALSPVMLAGTAFESRTGARSSYRKAVQEFRADVTAMIAEVTDAVAAEAASRRLTHPAVADCIAAVEDRSPLLWSREPGTPTFLEVRLGIGRQPARTTVVLPDIRHAVRALVKEVEQACQPLATVEDVPVVGALAGSGALGVAGERSRVLGAARGLLLQVAALHSPAEVVVVAFGSPRVAPVWQWLKWLPHCSSVHSPLPGEQFASTPAATTTLLGELESMLTERTEPGRGAVAAPAVVVLVDDPSAGAHARLVELGRRGVGHGLHVLWCAEDVAALPSICGQYLRADPSGVWAVGSTAAGAETIPVIVEAIGEPTATRVARLLSPMVDAGAVVTDESDLPRSMSLLALTGTAVAESSEAVVETWIESGSIVSGPRAPLRPSTATATLHAIVGQTASGPLALDLRRDGPHALVGGTTGAGKSELLQAWILGMAVEHSPQRLAFLLVDYKGGSAFRDCTELPHTVGLVTDLSPHLVRRALTSLAAELRHREHILGIHKAKDLIELERRGVPDTPPSLVIVVDEFAALVKDVPEFVEGVVDVAQRGRSLGLHLILATQRPAGVIKDNLRANTNLRLALRMADEADSSDVLGSPEAAFFDPALPGRAVSKTGPGRLVPFQTGYAGGWTNRTAEPADVRVDELGFGRGAIWTIAEPAEPEEVDLGPTDIKRLVTAIGKASRSARISAPRKPWLPELAESYDLGDPRAMPTQGTDTELVFAVRDDPDNQRQPTAAFLPDRDGNLAVFGTGGSGKSTVLRTLAIAAGFRAGGSRCQVYGLDFGARGLAMIEDLPHVGSIIAGADHERVTRLLRWLRELIDERALRYSRADAGTLSEYRSRTGSPDEQRILLLLDGAAAFRSAYEVGERSRWFDTLTSIATDGRPVGVHLVLSADRPGALPSALASAIQRRVTLRLADAGDYSLMGVPGDVLDGASPPGRGLLDGSEIQVAVLGADSDVGAQAQRVRLLADELTRALEKEGAAVATPIERLTDSVALPDLPPEVDGMPTLGIRSDSLTPIGFEPVGTFLISGPPGSGRATAVLAVAQSLARARPATQLCYLGNRRSPIGGWSGWAVRAVTPDEVAEIAAELARRLADTAPGDPSIAVFVESVSDFFGGPAEAALQDLVKVCVAEEILIVAEGETTTVGGSYGLAGLLKSSRAGLALAPETMDGPTVYRTNFPARLNRADFPPGRALLVRGGTVALLQVGLPVTT